MNIFIRKAIIFLSLALSLNFQFTFAQSETWTANWIWTNETGLDNTWVNIRKKVTLDSKPTTALTRIAAENKYWLFVNDSLVVNDGGLDTRPDLQNTYYDEIDLAPYLTSGENIISALVWHKGGPDCYTQRTIENGGFLFESHLTGSTLTEILTDRTWKIKVDSAFLRGVLKYKYGVSGTVTFSNDNFGGDPLEGMPKFGYYRPAGSTQPFKQCANENESFTLPEKCDIAYGNTESPLRIWNSFKWLAYPVTYDARLEIKGWHTYDYDDSSWTYATEKGIPPVSPWNKLVNRTIPMWKDNGYLEFTNQSELLTTISGNDTIEAILDNNIQGMPYFKINAPAGVRLRMVLNDYYYQDYITKEGEQEFECFAWQNSSSHKVQLQFNNVSGSIEILDLKFHQTSYNTEIIGSFNSNDTLLNTLWEKCKNTSLVCMRDYFFDCPDRERGQWWGDVSEQILYAFYIYGQQSTLLSKKAYRELMYTQKEDGSLYTTAPGTEFHLPDQNLAAVSMLWNYYLYTGDKELLVELYPYIKKYINYLVSTSNADGLLILQPDVWNWIDWGGNMDNETGSVNAVSNAIYSVLLSNMIHIAETLNKTDDILFYKGLQEKVKVHFNDYFWNGEAYAYHKKDGVQSKVVDDRTNAWAVLAGFADEDKKDKILEILKTRYDASPYQEMYIDMAMLQLDPVATLNRIRTRYKAMVDSWSSTLWEEFPAKGSTNHAWSAGPLYNLSAFYLGIRPLKPAYSLYEFLPITADLTHISGTVPTPHGTISASFNLDNEAKCFTQEISSPDHTVCLVCIPKKVFGGSKKVKITVNSVTIWRNNKPGFLMDGVEFDSEDEAYIKFKVNPGNYTFVSTSKR
ncbi:GH116 family glycosyl hydrolase [Plebeiibacterium marinum]|uniref:GH116 family glycosyl hydrolase n=1 Tax=Plebeiibacterium marinum TaxID=2992111 RepID=A0AAE3SI83_9BACT|nr:GH116 family glycosyl hydrolase [Plebeiobacterium marinum]MCW3804455.1 GH116 family glycosyl hydrolase [Plebeiobacterium marinum]